MNHLLLLSLSSLLTLSPLFTHAPTSSRRNKQSSSKKEPAKAPETQTKNVISTLQNGVKSVLPEAKSALPIGILFALSLMNNKDDISEINTILSFAAAQITSMISAYENAATMDSAKKETLQNNAAQVYTILLIIKKDVPVPEKLLSILQKISLGEEIDAAQVSVTLKDFVRLLQDESWISKIKKQDEDNIESNNKIIENMQVILQSIIKHVEELSSTNTQIINLSDTLPQISNSKEINKIKEEFTDIQKRITQKKDLIEQKLNPDKKGKKDSLTSLEKYFGG